MRRLCTTNRFLSSEEIRRGSVVLWILCNLFACLLFAGCAGPSGIRGGLSALRGQPVLVLLSEQAEEPGGEEDSETLSRALALERSLALFPLRTWPASADLGLETIDGWDQAREKAETRRLPWLLIQSESGLRLETARGGRVLWSSHLERSKEARVALHRALQMPVERRSSLLLDRVGSRLLPYESLQSLREALLEGRFDSHRAEVAGLVEAYPVDPALRVHQALPGLLFAANAGVRGLTPDELRQAQALNPEGESELLALALSAESRGQAGLAHRLRHWLVSLYPDRLRYLPEFLEGLSAQVGPSEALREALVHLQRAQGARPPVPPEGSLPAGMPSALPYADLLFSTAWLQGTKGEWSYAAQNYDSAALRYERMGRSREQGDALNNIGVAWVEGGKPKRALSPLREAIRLRQMEGDDRVASSRYNLGKALWEAGRLQQAAQALERSALDSEAAGQALDAFETRIEVLDLQAMSGDREALERRAAELMTEAESLSKKILEGPDTAQHYRAEVLFSLGKGRSRFDDLDGAMEAYRQAENLWNVLGKRLEVGQCLYSMAIPAVAMGKFDLAFDQLLRALRIAVELGDTDSILAIREQLPPIEDLALRVGQALPEIPEDLLPFVGGTL